MTLIIIKSREISDLTFINNSKKNIMKKKIIVPIDLSPTSHNAYLYARKLAKDLDATIDVIHVHTVTDREKKTDFSEKMEIIKEQLADFINVYPREEEVGTSVLTKVKVNKRLIIGMPVKSILRASQHPSSYLYVMGMTGAHNAVGRFLGTVSSAVAQRAKCPVLLIPKGMKYTSFKDILFASNYESTERSTIKKVTKFAEFFNAGIHFVHVRGKEEVEEFTQTEEQIFERLFEEGDPTFRFNLTAIEAKSISKGINQYANENDIDLITLVNSRKGFLELMFNKSVTKQVAFSTKLPLLVFHLTN